MYWTFSGARKGESHPPAALALLASCFLELMLTGFVVLYCIMVSQAQVYRGDKRPGTAGYTTYDAYTNFLYKR